MSKQTHCAGCRFASIDPKAPGNGIMKVRNRRKGVYRSILWQGVECDNPGSEYYKALLNVNPEGQRMQKITWPGCPHGKRMDA